MKKPLTSTLLKLIACLTMLADHVGYAFLPSDSLLYAILRVIGRMAFPLYCFLLVEGVYHTKDSKKYLLRLVVLALLSEPVFDLLCFRKWVYLSKWSVMVTLLLGAAMCMLMKKLPKYWMKPLVVIPFYFLTKYIYCDYGTNGILMIALFMLTHDLPLRPLWQVPLFGLLCIRMGGWTVKLLWRPFPSQWFAVLALVPILLYGGKKGSQNKALSWVMNLFYPVHMAIIVIIKLILL